MKSHEIYKIANEIIHSLNCYNLTSEEIKTIFIEVITNFNISLEKSIVNIKYVDKEKLKNEIPIYVDPIMEMNSMPHLCRDCYEWHSCKGTNRDCNSQEV